MARLDTTESFETLKSRVKESITNNFPQEGDKNILEIKGVEIKDEISSDDVTTQKASKVNGRTWGVPVLATMVLKDKKTGKVLDERRQKVATLPKITNRYSWIVDGSEFQVDNQWRLKPGVYTKIKQNGELQSFFNIKGTPMHVDFDPKTRVFKARREGSNPPLYPIMKAMGISDDALEKKWGKDILAANKIDKRGRPVNVDKVALAFANKIAPPGTEVKDMITASQVIKETFAESALDPKVTKRTLGAPINKINSEALLKSSGRLLGIARGEEKPDVRDSLMYKDFMAAEDFISERIDGNSNIISRRIKNNLDRKNKIRDVVGPDIFQRPIKEFFAKVSLASTPEQTNPLKMISGQMRTTIAGEGGVKDANRITEDAKLVDPSHFGILDPLHTPEGDKTGVNLQLSLGAKKVKSGVKLPLINAKTGKTEYVNSETVHDSIIALPDSVKKSGKGYVPKKGTTVKVSAIGNEIMDVKMKDVQYVVPKSSQMFSIATNMVPFISSDSPNRATMAGRHMEQAIPVVGNEKPLVQSMLGKKSFDELVGQFASHNSPVDGKVTRVEKDAIVIQGSDRKKHKIPVYNNYPLNDKKGFIDSISKVKAGDEVKKGQLLADTNYTKDGVYSPGTNLNVAYMPWKGHNFEDGVVISESAAQKMSSEHMYKKGLSTREAHLPGKNKYQAYYPDRVNKEQMEKLDDDGVVHVGQKVKPGDTIVAALAERKLTTEEQKLRLLHKSLVQPYKDKAMTWEEDYEGEVVEVIKKGKKVDVHIKTKEPMQIGDKIVGRHGNKGIATNILPDEEMPATKDGKPIEVLMNPIGTPGRMNLGQVCETAAGKIADKRGTPFKIANFEVDDNLTHVENELKKEGLPDKEDLVDPATGKSIKGIQVGKQYILKLEHQVGKKMAARDRDSYDRNLVPKGGGPHGAQALGSLGMYAMLAHGSKANIREMQTLKSDKAQGGDNDELWGALQSGEMLPPPKTTFAYKKFNAYLKGMGVNTEKDGNSLNLIPITDKQVEEMSSGELKDPGRVIKMRTLQPEKGGLFDPKITGGHEGTRWSHIKLKKPMPNPLFEKAIMSVTGVRKPQYYRLIDGEDGVTKDGTIVSESGVEGAVYGPDAVGRLLEKVDVKSNLKDEEKRIPKLKGQLQNESRRKIKFLKALNKIDMKPTDAYMMRNVPVLPPNMRPVAALEDGSIQTDDLNELYKNLGIVNKKLGEFPSGTPSSVKAPVSSDVYDHLKALTGLGGNLNRKHPGIIDVIAGKGGPKTGYAQDVLIKRKMDMTARSTIVPDPALSLDEAEIPKKAAKEMYKAFIVRDLKRTAGVTPLKAKKMIEENDPLAQKALERVSKERPVLLKRDPVLHKYGIQAFKPRLVDGKAIKIHPLVCSGYNADFDGDTMSAYVPITQDAVKEARDMFPSRNLFSPATGKVMYQPSHESQVGLFMKAEVDKKTNLSFKGQDELRKAVKDGKLGPNDLASVGGVKTTLGRSELNELLPKQLQGGKLLTDPKYRFTKGEQAKMFNQMAKADKRNYPSVINKLKNMGNDSVTSGGFSFGIEDFKVHRDVRDPILNSAAKKAAKLNLNKKEDIDKFADIYEDAMNKIDSKLKVKINDPKQKSHLAKLEISAGIKGRGYRQLTAAPVMFVDGKSEIVTSPVTKSYSEGLDTASYWAATSGGRKGAIQKVQSVSKPGYMTKLMMNSTMDHLVAANDCNTERGVSLSLDEPDIVGRYTTADTKLQKGAIPAGTLLTPDLVSRMKNSKVTKVVVRSPMRCNHGKGVCAKCMGLNEDGQLPDKGTNVGVLAAQSLGERGTQLAMKSFHCLHAKSLVTVQDNEGHQLTLSLERLFEMMDFPIEEDEMGEFKDCSSASWKIYNGNAPEWTELLEVRRHEPERPMMIVSDSSGVTICQDNHPIAYRPNLVQCERCGYHRLKKPGKNATIKNGKHFCPKCNRYQYPPEVAIGESIQFAQAGELESKRVYLERFLLPPNLVESDLDIDPYLAGLYVAEGSISYRWTNRNNKVRKPYSFTISQRDGAVREKLEERLPSSWGAKLKDRSIEIHCLALASFMEDTFSRYSRNVSLPPTFFGFSREWLSDFLSGVIDGDGTKKSDTDGADRLSVDTTSFELAQQLVMICAKLNIAANLHCTKIRKRSKHQGFRVTLRVTEEAKSLLKESIKATRIEKLSPNQDCKVSGSCLMSSSKHVMYTDELVYDVTTSSGTFVGSGLLNHNSGGVYEGRKAAGQAIDAGGLDRATNVLTLKKKVKGSATLAQASGKITAMKKDPAGGFNVMIGGTRSYVPANRVMKGGMKVGASVKKGDPLTRGPINPHDMLPLTGMSKVQGHMAGELHSIYGQYGIKRRHSELMIRALSNVTKVEDKGDHPDLLPGDFATTSQVYQWNKKAKGMKPVRHKPVLRGVKQIPLDVQTDWMARLNHEHLKDTIIDAAQQGWQSNLHGQHPIPPLIHGAEFGKGTKDAPWAY